MSDYVPTQNWEGLIRRFRIAPFVLAVVSFLLPFVQISCQDIPAASLTGLQLAFGTRIERTDRFTQKTKTLDIPSQSMALLAFVAAAGAVAAGLPKTRRGAVLSAIAGAIGGLALIILKVQLDNDVIEHGQGMLTLQYRIGFIAALLCLMAGVAGCGYLISKERQTHTIAPVSGGAASG